jgi:hypothetical protein
MVQGGHKFGHSPEEHLRRGNGCDSCNRLKGEELAGTPGRIRTYDLLLRRQTLYPAELRVRLAPSLAENRPVLFQRCSLNRGARNPLKIRRISMSRLRFAKENRGGAPAARANILEYQPQ